MMDSLRGWINQYSAVVTIGAVLLMIVSLVIMMGQCGGPQIPPRLEHVWFYDLNTKQLFPAHRDEVPPIDAPSGQPYTLEDGTQIPAGVKAHVFSCTDCGDETTHFVGYLERFTNEAKQKLQSEQQKVEGDDVPLAYLEGSMDLSEGKLICDVDAKQWVNIQSSEARDIMAAFASRCAEGTRLRKCFPPKP